MTASDFCKCGHQRHNHWGGKKCVIGVKCDCKKFSLKETYAAFLKRTEPELHSYQRNMEKAGL